MLTGLQHRISLLFLAFAVLVLISVTASAWIIETQKQDALVINLAGRQRMLIQQMTKDALEIDRKQGNAAVHRQAIQQAVQTFEQTLQALTDGGPAPYLPDQPAHLSATNDPAIRNTLLRLAENWTGFRRNLENIAAGPPDNSRFTTAIQAIETTSPELVQQADVAVRLFENESAQKVARLRRVQAIFLISAVGLLIIGIGVTQKLIIKPLRQLGRVADRIGDGDLETPVTIAGPDEIAHLARNFDGMRRRLKLSQDDLEAKVGQRTRELATAFEFSQEIVTELELKRLLSSVTGRAQDLLNAKAASLCLLTTDGRQLVLQASSGTTTEQPGLHQPAAGRQVAVQVVGDGQTVITETACANCRFLKKQAPGHCVATPLRVGDRTLGALCVVRPHGHEFETEETRALSLLANSAATAIVNANLIEAGQRQAQETAALAEREKLAAELHDNLAQTLSFLNLKTDRMCELVTAGQTDEAEAELDRMKAAINTAYGQVRAALVGLREPMTNQDHNLAKQLATAVEDLAAIAPFEIDLAIVDEAALVLPSIAQRQALHIVKESLNNARRHARARHVSVHIERENGQARFSISDDGCGFDLTLLNNGNHYGLTIMRARAERCGGSLEIDAAPGRGTKIIASFPLIG